MKHQKSCLIILSVIAMTGVALLGLGGYLGYNMAHIEKYGSRVEGTVIQLAGRSDFNSKVYCPVIKFERPEGHPGQRYREFVDGACGNPPLSHQGDRIAVLYDDSGTKLHEMVDHGIWNWAAPAGCGGLGLVMLLIAALQWRKASNRL